MCYILLRKFGIKRSLILWSQLLEAIKKTNKYVVDVLQ